MALINLRGTSGSGKSTVVKLVMEKYGDKFPIFVEGRRQPEGYRLSDEGCLTPVASTLTFYPRILYVLGHYESPCGGGDTIKTTDESYRLVSEAAALGYDVMFEGIMIQDDTKRAIALNQKFPGQLTIIELITPIQECLAGVQSRRDARGDTRELNPTNTIGRADRVRKTCSKLRDNGLKVLKCDREEAYLKCLELLGWS